MAFEDFDSENLSAEAPPPAAKPTGNRTFMIIAGALGGVVLLVLIALGVFAALALPRQRQQQVAAISTLGAQQTQMSNFVTATSEAVQAQRQQAAARQAEAATAAAIAAAAAPTATQPPPPTSVLVPAVTNTPALLTPDPRTATVAALRTMIAVSTRTPGAQPSATALPKAGFADDVGLPLWVGAAVLLLIVFVLARRLRSA